MRKPDHSRFSNFRMSHQTAFHFHRAQAVPRNIQHVVNSTHDPYVTVFIMTSQEYAYTSSNLIKQIAALGGSVDSLRTIVPENIIKALKELQQGAGLEHLIEDHVD